jgi:hypothetical protein
VELHTELRLDIAVPRHWCSANTASEKRGCVLREAAAYLSETRGDALHMHLAAGSSLIRHPAAGLE